MSRLRSMRRLQSNPVRSAQRAGAPALRRAFTLTELLVAVGAVALLTVGVGQIFRSVGKLTSSGQAIGEVDGLARVVETQLREDFASLTRCREEDAMLAIRMREIGDLDRNGQVDSPQEPARGVYLSADDEQIDKQNGYTPYQRAGGPSFTPLSRAVTTRLDEIVFLAQAPPDRPYASAQVAPTDSLATNNQRTLESLSEISAPAARIRWGHALRPLADPQYNPNPTSNYGPPRRQYLPDGDFAQAAGEQMNLGNPFTGGNINVKGRNRHAGQWLLGRQAALLFGGTAAGETTGRNLYPTPGGDDPPFADDAEFSPYVRDLEGVNRVGLLLGQTPPTAGFPTRERLLLHGRSDVIAQTAEDVRRWIEGEGFDPDGVGGPRLPAPAPAFDTGYYSTLSTGENAPLWFRTIDVFTNLRNLRSAVAGMFFRPLADETPPIVLRDRSQVTNAPETPEDALMDAAAIIATRCSRFEIAWSDGSSVVDPQGIDWDGDMNTGINGNELKQGEIVWFDITPRVDSPARRRTYKEAQQAFNPVNEIAFASGDSLNDPFASPEVRGYAPFNETTTLMTPGNGLASGVAHYSRTLSLGPTSGASEESFAIWGFRKPTADGNYGAAWPKPKFLRIRMTLHDSQGRLREGKQFEFVVPLVFAGST